jgi:hypothetical protein
MTDNEFLLVMSTLNIIRNAIEDLKIKSITSNVDGFNECKDTALELIEKEMEKMRTWYRSK